MIENIKQTKDAENPNDKAANMVRVPFVALQIQIFQLYFHRFVFADRPARFFAAGDPWETGIKILVPKMIFSHRVHEKWSALYGLHNVEM
jgi:hypothetical protein